MCDVTLDDQATSLLQISDDLRIRFLQDQLGRKYIPRSRTFTLVPWYSGTSCVKRPASSIGQGGISSSRTTL